MTAAQYRARIAKLGLNQQAAAVLLGHGKRTGQTWAKDGPPQIVAMLLLAVKDLPTLEALARRATQKD